MATIDRFIFSSIFFISLSQSSILDLGYCCPNLAPKQAKDLDSIPNMKVSVKSDLFSASINGFYKLFVSMGVHIDFYSNE